jgi:hypothetical protein
LKEESNVSLFAICVNNSEYPASLELHKFYRVLPDEEAAANGDMRVIDESGEDYLYPAEWFVLVELPEVVEQSLLQVVLHTYRSLRSSARINLYKFAKNTDSQFPMSRDVYRKYVSPPTPTILRRSHHFAPRALPQYPFSGC